VPIDELICRSWKGELSAEEQQRLLAWRRHSRRNAEYYRDLHRALELAECAALDVEIPPPPSIDTLLCRSARAVRNQRSRARRWATPLRGGAVAIAAAAAIALLVLGPLQRPAEPPFSFTAGEFVTGTSETATLVLSDGTVVRLAPDSRLNMSGVAGSREVFLQGKAYFVVAKMDGYPFRVQTPVGEAVVLGTRFELRTQGDDLRLVVVEGKVALDAEGQRVEVEAGEVSQVSKGRPPALTRVEDVAPLVTWVGRFLVFQSTPLHEVALELEREYGVRVEVTDEALAEQTITGWYTDRSFDEVFAIVCGVLQANCSVEGDLARIQP
jgi:transmembrane sensor